jgi:hypothetical protein
MGVASSHAHRREACVSARTPGGVGFAYFGEGGAVKLLSLYYSQGEWDVRAGGRVSFGRRWAFGRCARDRIGMACLLACLLFHICFSTLGQCVRAV